jgi:hypothetical protein
MVTLAAAAVAAAMAAPAAAQTEPQRNPLEDAPDVELLRSILSGLGVRRGDEAGIEYRERSPLVVPPQFTLPPPETRTLAQRNPNWPVDQDVRRAREAARQRPSPHYDPLFEGRALRPEEMAPGPRGRPPTVLGQTTTPEEGGAAMSPSALGYVGNLFTTLFDAGKPEAKAFAGEPPRTSLIAPPPGYQTPSPNYAYGSGQRVREAPKAMDPMDQPARSY